LLFVDTDGEGRADQEIVVADGWKELPHGVDALGVAVDPKDQSIYFGLGTQDYEDAYGRTKKDANAYDLKSERGTVLRVGPDFKSREIVATGIRFSVALRFNRHGDLFGTDQEGATWLANGNPFDELLHIQKGRHYGFPPRHPKYLPNVIDEPSVFDYAPQHQSTCGLNFNEPVNGGPIVGPPWWQSDAFVAGYSRGKLYRTKLIKTQAGYIAQNQLLACLNMLACDVCVSPQGDLVVAVHSGGPDWGSGPTGKGRLYKIHYEDKEAAQPALVWAQTPREVRIAFDRPLMPDQLSGLKATIEFGRYVSAGDRFESLWPGYRTVQAQFRSPRSELPVHSIQLTPDRRTVILATGSHRESVGHVVTLLGLGRSAKPKVVGELPQAPESDLRYDLCGVECRWRSPNGGEIQTWLPHLDLDVARSLTQVSAEHERFWAQTRQTGELILRTQLNLRDMLRPAVQPGSTIDYEWPPERVTLTLRSRSEFRVKSGSQPETSAKAIGGSFLQEISFDAAERVPLEIRLPTNADGADLQVTWHTNEDDRPRALPLHRLLLPWAPAMRSDSAAVAAVDSPELKGGNWSRGRRIFFSDEAQCSKCHAIHGDGGAIGPNLSNLPERDYRSVLRDIVEPNFAINPDFITQRIVLKNGRVLSGSVRTDGDALLVGDEKGQVTRIPRIDIEEASPSGVSIMPEGIPKLLGPDKLRDLMTFLLTDPPRMPEHGRDAPPEPRRRKDVEAILTGATPVTQPLRELRIVLVAGRKDHGVGEHDYPAWQRIWSRLLRMAENVTATTANDWPTPQEIQSADVLVFYQQGSWTPDRARDIDTFLARGGGLVYIHFAVDGGKDAPGFAQRIGLAWEGGQSKFRHGSLDLGFETGLKHPIGRNFQSLHFHDESYWRLVGDRRRLTLIAGGVEDGEPQPLFWTLEPTKGRVFVSIPGHYAWTFDDPLFRILILRGIAWSARESVDRFNDLVTPGARIRD
jgi:putative heme-binding domain-containing protein